MLIPCQTEMANIGAWTLSSCVLLCFSKPESCDSCTDEFKKHFCSGENNWKDVMCWALPRWEKTVRVRCFGCMTVCLKCDPDCRQFFDSVLISGATLSRSHSSTRNDLWSSKRGHRCGTPWHLRLARCIESIHRFGCTNMRMENVYNCLLFSFFQEMCLPFLFCSGGSWRSYQLAPIFLSWRLLTQVGIYIQVCYSKRVDL